MQQVQNKRSCLLTDLHGVIKGWTLDQIPSGGGCHASNDDVALVRQQKMLTITRDAASLRKADVRIAKLNVHQQTRWE